MSKKTISKKPEDLLCKKNLRHIPTWNVHSGCHPKYNCCPKFAKTAKASCCPEHFEQSSISRMHLACLSPRQIRTIHQYEADFLNRYNRSVILLALRGTK